VLDLASLDQIFDRSGHIFHWHIRVRPVLVEQVNRLHPQAFERIFRDRA